MRKQEIITEEERKTQDPSAVADYEGEKSNRAKLVDFEGDDYEDVPVRDNSLDGRISNFWYHYKWHTIIISFAVLFLFVGIYQIASKEKVDVSVMYTGNAVISGDNYTALSDAFDEILSQDFDGDGNKNVYVYSITYLTKRYINEQMELYASQGIDTNQLIYDVQSNQKAYSQFGDMVFAGEAGVLFLDEELFLQVKESGGLVSLEDALGREVDNAFDTHGVRLVDTAFYQFYNAAKIMPENTIICLRGPATTGGVLDTQSNVNKNFERTKSFFCDLLNFELPEGYKAPAQTNAEGAR